MRIMQWTDHIRRIKIGLVVMAIVIAVASLAASSLLTKDLAQQERSRMEVWAEAMRALSQADENTDLALVLKVLNENNTIPVIVLDNRNRVTDFRNVRLKAESKADSMRQVSALAQRYMEARQFIKIPLSAGRRDVIVVCYDESMILKRLAIYPYVQLGMVVVFVVLAIFALLTLKRSEQNKIWGGLSKETAHQLGTPISSLMAWTTILRETYPHDALLPEMDKDVKRLQLIADRFSKIGSKPEPVPSSLNNVLEHVVDYMDKRTSKHVRIALEVPNHEIIVKMNASLFEWVIENLCKNAVDAMKGEAGTITLHVEETAGEVSVEVSDTGKGIRKKDVGNVFRPGFTTKHRGWGLGLSLAKRIVEEYHHGKIYVKSSAPGRGTTFRIELKKRQ